MHTQHETDPEEYRRATQLPKPSSVRRAPGEGRIDSLFRADRTGAISLAAADKQMNEGSQMRVTARALGLCSESDSDSWLNDADEDDDDDDDDDENFDFSEGDPFAMDLGKVPTAADRVQQMDRGPPIPATSADRRPGKPLRVPEHNSRRQDVGELYTAHRFVPMSDILGEDDILEISGEEARDDRPLEQISPSHCFLCQFDAFPLEYDGDQATVVAQMQEMIEEEVDERGIDDRQIAVQLALMHRHCIASRGAAVLPLTAQQALAHIRYHRNGRPLVFLSKMVRDNERLLRTLDDRQWEEKPDDSQPKLNMVNVQARLKIQSQTANLIKTAAALRKAMPGRKSTRAGVVDRLRGLTQFRAQREVPEWRRGAFERRRRALMPSNDSNAPR